MARATLVNLGDGFAGRVVPGFGEVTFWIHAYTLDSASWAGLWDRLPGWRHVSVDLPGHGSSLPLHGVEELCTLARKIGALAIAREARHLVALSFGTVVALQIALEYPDEFATLTLGSPILGGGPFDAEIWTRYAELKKLFSEIGYGPHLRDQWMGPGASLFQGLDRCPQLREQLRRQVAKHSWWELSDDAYSRLWHTPQRLREFRRIKLPTLLLTGGEDCAAVKQCSYFLERLIPGCEHRDLAGLGHLCLLEDPPCVQPVIEQHWLSHASRADDTRKVSNHAAHN